MILINIILKEREYAKKVLNNGTIDKKPKKTLAILIRYYLSEGLSAEETETKINNFMTSYYKNYNPALWYKEIGKMINQGKIYLKNREDKGRQLLVNINSVHITLNELNKIKQLKSIRLEKLAFALLVYGKIGNQINENMNYWTNVESKDLFSDARMTDGKIVQDKLLHQLVELKYIEKSKKVDSTSLKILFADDSDEIAITISNFDGFIYEYLKWKGENVIACCSCSSLMIAKSNRQKYCLKCRKNKKN